MIQRIYRRLRRLYIREYIGGVAAATPPIYSLDDIRDVIMCFKLVDDRFRGPFSVGLGSNFAISYWLWRSSLQHSLYRVSVWWYELCCCKMSLCHSVCPSLVLHYRRQSNSSEQNQLQCTLLANSVFYAVTVDIILLLRHCPRKNYNPRQCKIEMSNLNAS